MTQSGNPLQVPPELLPLIEKRSGKDRRSGRDRRRLSRVDRIESAIKALNGVLHDRRSGVDRRSGKDRRKQNS